MRAQTNATTIVRDLDGRISMAPAPFLRVRRQTQRILFGDTRRLVGNFHGSRHDLALGFYAQTPYSNCDDPSIGTERIV